MNKCVLILPYFGSFKNYFNMFLSSCAKNIEFDWLIISDQECKTRAKNIKWITMSFFDFKNLVQSKFDFEISLEKPYKLCDYKPAYGYILQEYIVEYAYWGHCDCDLIFGELSPIIEIMNQGYDKIFAAGHLTIYKNTDVVNTLFKSKSKNNLYLYKIVYRNEEIFGFDEDYFVENVHTIFQEQGMKIFDKDMSYNISPTYYNFVRQYYAGGKTKWVKENKHLQLLLWDGSDVFSLHKEKGRIVKRSFIYVHLLMRKYINTIPNNEDCGLIKLTPNEFETIQYSNDLDNIWKKEKKFYFSFEIIKRFIRERYYEIKSKGEIAAEHDPYKKYRI